MIHRQRNKICDELSEIEMDIYLSVQLEIWYGNNKCALFVKCSSNG